MRDFIYLDNILLAVAKPAGIPHNSQYLTQHIKGEWVPVHRLDTETSGVLLFAHPDHVPTLRQSFRDTSLSQIRKIYWAASTKTPPDEGLVEGWIGGRYRSSKKVQFALDQKRLRGWHSIQPMIQIVRHLPEPPTGFHGHAVEVEIKTGARHQIRASLAALGFPLNGDTIYGGPEAERLELHAWMLEIPHPITGEMLNLKCPLELALTRLEPH
jgi:23S rRNA pseudouridine1911/1915/1917 synthase